MFINEKDETLTDVALPGHRSEAVAAAMAVINEEKALSFRQAFKMYWKAAVWSALLSTALVMEGYDVGIVRITLESRSLYLHPGQFLLWSSRV